MKPPGAAMPRCGPERPPFNLTVVLPVHNEAAILEQNVVALERHLDALPQLDASEILLVCNGCSDGSLEVGRTPKQGNGVEVVRCPACNTTYELQPGLIPVL